jgi:dTDP-4-amino-4,6-dideoxygalactose transaminase
MLRFHGSRDKVTYEQVGYNSRLDELQAALLRVMLPHLEEWSDGRRAAARAYRDCGLGALATLPTPTESADPAWHLYVIRHPEAERLAARLADDGIESRGYYRTPVHRQPAMARYAANVALPVTDELAETHLAIPISPRMGGTAVEQVVQSIRAAT